MPNYTKQLFLLAVCAVFYTQSLHAQSCTTGSVTATANATPDSIEVCTGSAVQLQLSAPDAAACSGNWEYLWFDGNNYYDGTGFNAANEVWHSSYNIINLSSVIQTATYKGKIRCSSDYACTDSSVVKVIVNPVPVCAQKTNILVCPGAVINIGDFVGTPSGTSFTWTNSNTAIGLATSGSGNIPSWNALCNSTCSNITSTITVTPTLNGCPGYPMSFTVSISPIPDVFQKPNISVCPGALINVGNFSGCNNSITWTNSNTAIGLGASGSGNIPSWNALCNSTCSNITSTITVTPTLNGCPGYPMSFTVTIYPSPQLNQMPNIAVCPGQLINVGYPTGCPSGFLYSWTNTNPNIGIPATGTWIPSWTAPANNTGSNITGTITMTPSFNGCPGPPMSFTVTIYPEPGTPPLVIGPGTSNEGTTNTYTVNAVPGATSYIWTVPAGWTIVSGQGTNSLTVITGPAGQNGNISVSAVNLCDTSAAYLFPVSSVLGTTSVISGIINTYYPVTDYCACTNSVTLSSCQGLSVGDKVLLIQMKGAGIDTSNSVLSGSITNYNTTGNYEIAIIDSLNACRVFLRDSLVNTYTVSGTVQLVKIPQYNDVAVSDTLTCQKWNGSTGGVLIFEAQGSVTLNAPVDVSGKGFNGGALFTCNADYLNTSPLYVMPSYLGNKVKGEGISTLPAGLIGGRGTQANGGGAAGAQPALNGMTDAWFNGGGGGGNYGAGGHGGKSSTFYSTQYPGGLGGRALSYSNLEHKIFMGGGGGAGHRRYNTSGPTNGSDGGGIVIVRADSLAGNSAFILADGIDNQGVLNNAGRGGGGAGGTILLDVQNYSGTLNVSVKGGHGGDNAGSNRTGPGGGGGGGVVWVNQPTLPSNITCNVSGGTSGLHMTYTDPWGATDGAPGATLNSLILPAGQNLFVPFITTTNITSNSPVCEGDTLLLTAVMVSGIDSFLWVGPNGFVSHSQNPQIPNTTTSHAGVYTLFLIDNGCAGLPANLTVTIKPKPAPPITSDTASCFGQPVPPLTAIGNGVLQWYPGCVITPPPIYVGSEFNTGQTTYGVFTYCVTASENQCESDAATATLTIYALPLCTFNLNGNDTICLGTASTGIQLSGSQTGVYYQLYQNSVPYSAPLNGTGNMLEWQSLPVGVYTVEATYNNSACSVIMPDTVTISEWPPLQVDAGQTQFVYVGGIGNLIATVSGGSGSYLYQWEPALLVVDPHSDSTTTIPINNIVQYTLFVTDSATLCTYSDSLCIIPWCSTFPVNASANHDSVCTGDTVSLNVTSPCSYSYDNYFWTSDPPGFNSSIVNPIVMPSVTTTYIVTGTNDFDTATSSVVVTVNSSLTQYPISSDVYCLSNTTDTISTSGSDIGVYYQLYRNDTAYGPPLPGTGAALTWDMLGSGIYYLEGYDSTGLPCNNYFSNSLHIGQTPAVTLGNDTTLCDINTLLLSGPPGNGYAYTWLRLPDDTLGQSQYLYLDYSTSGLGMYYYVLNVSDSFNCTGSDTIGVNFQICPSVKELNNPLKPLVYPNPATEFIFVESKGYFNNSCLWLYNAQGQAIAEQKISAYKTEINTHYLPAGFYMLKISDGKNFYFYKVILE